MKITAFQEGGGGEGNLISQSALTWFFNITYNTVYIHHATASSQNNLTEENKQEIELFSKIKQSFGNTD